MNDGVERGGARLEYIFLERTREGQRQSDEHWHRFTGNVWENLRETGCSAYGLLRAHRYHPELERIELENKGQNRNASHRVFLNRQIDKKAFDSVQRGLLWGQLLNSGVNGKVSPVIRDMYAKAKSCVKTRHGLSHFFVSKVGLRRGENVSPVLFSLFLNDLKGVFYK